MSNLILDSPLQCILTYLGLPLRDSGEILPESGDVRMAAAGLSDFLCGVQERDDRSAVYCP